MFRRRLFLGILVCVSASFGVPLVFDRSLIFVGHEELDLIECSHILLEAFSDKDEDDDDLEKDMVFRTSLLFFI